MTTTSHLEHRMAALEKQFRALKESTTAFEPSGSKEEFLRNMGSFTGDTDFKEAMQIGRKWREGHRRRHKRSTQAKRRK